jgi:hypothetical protein
VIRVLRRAVRFEIPCLFAWTSRISLTLSSQPCKGPLERVSVSQIPSFPLPLSLSSLSFLTGHTFLQVWWRSGDGRPPVHWQADYVPAVLEPDPEWLPDRDAGPHVPHPGRRGRPAGPLPSRCLGKAVVSCRCFRATRLDVEMQ